MRWLVLSDAKKPLSSTSLAQPPCQLPLSVQVVAESLPLSDVSDRLTLALEVGSAGQYCETGEHGIPRSDTAHHQCTGLYLMRVVLN